MSSQSSGVAPSVEILREQGALDLRELTRQTAMRMGWTLMYDDVDSVMERERDAGRVVVVGDAGDYRNRIWKAV